MGRLVARAGAWVVMMPSLCLVLREGDEAWAGLSGPACPVGVSEELVWQASGGTWPRAVTRRPRGR